MSNIPIHGFGPGGDSLGLVQPATALDSTHVRVTFTQPVLLNAALTTPSTYSISPFLSVFGVTPGPGATPLYVDLQTSEQRTGQIYTISLETVSAA